MSAERTAWHPLFAAMIEEQGPQAIQVFAEFVLTQLPQKADLLLLKKNDVPLNDAQVLKGLWHKLTEHNLLEFKSIARPPRFGTWNQLYTYAGLYRGARLKALRYPKDLTLILAAPSKTPIVVEEARIMGWTMEPLGGGYYRVSPDRYPIFFVDLIEVARHEPGSLLDVFTSATMNLDNREVATWLTNHTMGTTKTKMQDLDGYDEIIEKILNGVPRDKLVSMLPVEERLAGLKPEELLAILKPEELLAILKPEDRIAGLTPEDRLAGLKPEDRIAGLTPEDRLAGLKPEERLAGLELEASMRALPVEVLRGLSADFIATLPEDVQAEIRRRIDA